MPPRLQLRSAQRLCLRPQNPYQITSIRQKRSYADDKPIAERPLEHNVIGEDAGNEGPNMNQLPHVSEEAAAMSKSKGESGPQVEEQGTPVQEMVKGDKEAQENLPKVMQDQIKKDKASGTRSYSTLARRSFQSTKPTTRSISTSSRSFLSVQEEFDLSQRPSWQPAPPQVRAQEEEEEVDQDEDDGEFEWEPEDDEFNGGGVLAQGLKFGVPEPMTQQSHLQRRYDPLIELVTNLIMRDGKKATAQKNMSIIFQHLATSPAPRTSSSHPLVLNGATLQALPLNPPMYLQVAIDSVAPLFRIRSQKGAAGGGVALQIPVPLFLRQRRRTAIMWILDQVNKKRGGTSPFAKRFGEEIVAIVEGRSATWERRTASHGMATRGRVNIAAANRRR